jgi:hypothetical protein
MLSLRKQLFDYAESLKDCLFYDDFISLCRLKQNKEHFRWPFKVLHDIA